MTRIAVIADPHIGVEKPTFVGNWTKAVAHTNARAPALTIILGDLTFDGANAEADCAFAAEAIRALESPCLILPGNHDVGDTERDSEQPTDAERLARWRRHFGEDHWLSDAVPGWRLIGLDSQSLATGLPDEATQWTFLERALETDRRVLVFLHQPLFLEAWDEADRPGWTVRPAARARLRALLGRGGVDAVFTAHMHRAWTRLADGEPTLVWVPATSFLTRDASMPPQQGTAITGITLLDLTPSGLSIAFDPVPGLETFYIEDFNGTLYPAPAR
ncbi:metallophosphoesterase family protein [Segnochrobactrum spirostomi]|uniref:Metallophosphoesterase n=1 Tax=Segnochrobactrum spirostomi TaxID=2608987 RepID=A0A6A7Y9G8_9HYPH|nr:metallophosphoesterase [Segnochrobactrum spirostomi]MQT15526.1 metallophosphoesterase [Segnochrobactrum spirostomi]